MAESNSFTRGCWRYVTARDLIENLPLELLCDHHLDRLPTGLIMAKMMWTQEACEYLHDRGSSVTSIADEEDQDTVLINLDDDFIRPHQFYAEADVQDEPDSTQAESNPGLGNNNPAEGSGPLDTWHRPELPISTQGQSGPGSGDPAEGPGPLETDHVWPRVEQPERTGILPGEIPIPAGMEDDDDDDDMELNEQLTVTGLCDFSAGTVIKYL